MAHASDLIDAAGLDCSSGCAVTAEWVDIEGSMFVRVRVEMPYEPLFGLSTFLHGPVVSEFTMMTQQQAS